MHKWSRDLVNFHLTKKFARKSVYIALQRAQLAISDASNNKRQRRKSLFPVFLPSQSVS